MDQIINQRILDNNKGVIVCVMFNGKSSYDIRYLTCEGYNTTLTIEWDDNYQNIPNGTLFYAHIDDSTNELLILSKEPFPY